MVPMGYNLGKLSLFLRLEFHSFLENLASILQCAHETE